MQSIWQRYKSPPSWVWFVAFAVSIGMLFLLGLRQEYLFKYWAYVAIYNVILIILGIFYLLKFYRLVKRQKNDHTIGARFTFNLLRVVPILTILPIASFYVFSFSTVQENTKLAEQGFQNLNVRLLTEINTIDQSLESYRAEEYFNISTNILNVIQANLDIENFEKDVTDFLNTLVSDNQICRAIILRQAISIVSQSNVICEDVEYNEDISSESSVVDKSSELLFTKLTLINENDTSDSITLLIYFIKDATLNTLFNKVKEFRAAVDNARININNTILTKQFIVDFITTITLTIIAMMVLISRMLGNLMLPLNNITIASRKISRGEYGSLVPKSTHDDDMNIVLSEFNKMSTQIKESRTGLDTKNVYLETIITYSDAIIAFDTKFRISLTNARAISLLDISDTQIIGKSYTALGLDFLHDIIQEFGTREIFSIDLAYKKLILDIHAATLTNNTKKLGYILIIKDITQITKNQKLLAWKEVARRMAHEVKNPLNPILLSAERLRNKILDGELSTDNQRIIDKTTKTIITQVKSIDSIISSFSALGESGGVNKQFTSLEEIIFDVRELYSSVDIVVHIEELPQLYSDKEAINRLFINLIKNSIEAQQHEIPIHIDITATTSNEKVKIVITDNGCGFNNDSIDTIFEPYVTTKSSGTGLGMAIVARIISEHQGNIIIDTSYTKGARFIITLPLATA